MAWSCDLRQCVAVGHDGRSCPFAYVLARIVVLVNVRLKPHVKSPEKLMEPQRQLIHAF